MQRMKARNFIVRSATYLVIFLIVAVLAVALLNRIAGLPDLGQRQASAIAGSGDETSLGRLAAPYLAANPGKAGIYELSRGLDAFAARAVLAREAELSIDTQYYMWHQDTVGRLLVYELLDAANRGVRVRLLIDDMYGSDGEQTWLAMDVHPNVEVRLFAPYSRRQPKYLQFLTRFNDVNARMHTKTFTVDNQATIVGGRNIGDEYFNATTELAFADNDVIAVGPPAKAVSEVFNDYWNSDYAYPVSILLAAASDEDLKHLSDSAGTFREQAGVATYLDAVSNSRFAESLRSMDLEFGWGSSEIVHDPWWKREQGRPGWAESLLISALKPHLLGAQEEVIMVSPYFVPGTDTVEALCGLAERDVVVRVLTNSLASNDVVAVHAGYSKHRETLLACGVELYELDEHLRVDQRKSFTWLPNLEKSSLHAKTMIIDRNKMFVGSFNYDQRSLFLNTEIGIVFEQEDIASLAAQQFEDNIDKVAFKVELLDTDRGDTSLQWTSIQDGAPVSYDTEPYVGAGTRVAVAVMRLLPVDWLL